MAVYYVVWGNTIKAEIDTSVGDVVALPLLAGGKNMSLLNREHIIALMNRTGWTAAKIIDYLGLVDERE